MTLTNTHITCLALLFLTFYMNYYKLDIIKSAEYYSNNNSVSYKIYPWQKNGISSSSTSKWLSKHAVYSLAHVSIITIWNLIPRNININYLVVVSHINFWLVIIPNLGTLGTLHWYIATLINTSVLILSELCLLFHYINNNKLKYVLIITFPVMIETFLWLITS